jgi:hypothetical protein
MFSCFLFTLCNPQIGLEVSGAPSLHTTSLLHPLTLHLPVDSCAPPEARRLPVQEGWGELDC